MQIPVLIERIGKDTYLAQPLNLSADGRTPEEALQKLQSLIEERIRAGSRIVAVDVQASAGL